MYLLKFNNTFEVRMGSPFNVAEVELTGNFVPSLNDRSFQDKGIVSSDGRVCYLIEWKVLEGNSPGFQLWKISEEDKSVKKSKVITGCCEAIQETQQGILLRVFGSKDALLVKLSDFN
ncbi:MAG: hypothetical protein ABI041_13535 [Bdellovibrionia bacterium]